MKGSPRGKFPSETADIGTNGESKEARKGKHSYINAIIRGAPRENLPSKWTMKKKIAEMMVVHIGQS